MRIGKKCLERIKARRKRRRLARRYAQYEILNRAKGWLDAMKLNCCPKLEVKDEKVIRQFSLFSSMMKGENGGIIAFSEEYSARLSGDCPSLQESIALSKWCTDIEMMCGTWRLGYFVSGRYKANDATVFSERSLALEIRGIEAEDIFNMISWRLVAFGQHAMLFKNYDDGVIACVR